MKIIGKTEKGFICEVTKSETRAVLGLNATEKQVDELNIGEEITFSKALHNLALLRDVRSSNIYYALQGAEKLQSEVNNVVAKLKAINEAAESLNDKIKKEEI